MNFALRTNHYRPRFFQPAEALSLFNDFASSWQDKDEEGAFIWKPRVDIYAESDRYVVTVEVPGVKVDDIKLEMEKGTLRISGEKKARAEKITDNFTHKEIVEGKFQRSFTFSEPLNEEHIEAKMKDGILTIEIKKRETVKPKVIQITEETN